MRSLAKVEEYPKRNSLISNQVMHLARSYEHRRRHRKRQTETAENITIDQTCTKGIPSSTTGNGGGGKEGSTHGDGAGGECSGGDKDGDGAGADCGFQCVVGRLATAKGRPRVHEAYARKVVAPCKGSD